MTTTDSDVTTGARTVLDRLVQAGITPERALAHIRGGWVQVDGRAVTEPDAAADPPAHVELRAIPWTRDG